MKKRQLFIGIIIFTLIQGIFVFAEFNPLAIPDSATVRKDLYYTWFTRSLDDLRLEKPIFRKNEAGDYFHISFQEFQNESAIICSPMESTLVLHKAAGTWILYRDKKTEQMLRIEYYFTDNPEVFLIIKPNRTKTAIDLSVYNAFLIKDLHFALSFEEFFALSFTQLYTLSKNLIPWQYFTPAEKSYDANIQLASQLRDFVDDIIFTPNRVYDENGMLSEIFDEPEIAPVSEKKSHRAIEHFVDTIDETFDNTLQDDAHKLSLSPLGYVKWVVDGLVFPQIASYLKIQPLKKQTIEANSRSRVESLSAYETIFASLDWTRNLATAYASVQLGRDLEFFGSGVEVNRSFFAISLDSDGYYKDGSHVPNSGYSAHILKPLLYMLALAEPERMYLAAIKEFTIDTKTGIQDIGHFYDALIFIPYFDEENVFQCPVFYAGKEIALDDLVANSKNDFFSLVRIKTELRFFPLKKE